MSQLFSKNQICKGFGVTRQAFYKAEKAKQNRRLREEFAVSTIQDIRRSQPFLGTRKLHYMLSRRGVLIGRDCLFRLLARHDLLVRKPKNYRRTTNSYHHFHKFSNLIKDIQVTESNQVFVSDITYLETREGFCYLALITDLSSRKIVGWDLSKSLSIEGSQRALRQALAGVSHPQNLIHHSDRGIQYCSHGYVEMLQQRNIKISMTEENHCYENAVAERINGTLKYEFLLGVKHASYDDALRMTREAIRIYNELRPHCSLKYRTPAEAYVA